VVDRDLLIAKASAVKKHLQRIEEKTNTDLETFIKDIDRQESVLFNLQMAIQNCIDVAAHIVSEEGFGVPGSTNEMFYMLEENGYIDPELTEKMVRAVGLRNLIAHEYARINLRQIFKIAREDVHDLLEFLKIVFKKTGIQE